MLLYNCQSRPELSRKSIAEIGRHWGLDPFETICQVLQEEIEQMHSVLVLGYVYPAELTHFAFDHPFCMVGSDATALALDKPLRGGMIQGAFTWAAWFFRHFVRDAKQFTVQEAVRRLTGLPAQRLRLKDRGTLRPGAWADLVIFDPATFEERGTDFEPGQIATGVRHVLVNGSFALRDGKRRETRSGTVLRHISG
jgi:N-acyl-D-aspartate/D-glutamate deacylase